MTVFLCEDGINGILSGVFAAYESRLNLDECRLELKTDFEWKLFCEYREVPLDVNKAKRVESRICKTISENAYYRIYRVSLHNSPERANRIFQFIQLGLKYGNRVLQMLQEPAVYEIFQMDRYVGNEAHFLREFVRFDRLSNGVYFCKIGPENQVLELLASHFSDRFPDMNWIIYDENHRTALLHSESGHVIMKQGIKDDELQWIRERKEEDCFTSMWRTFFHAIAIEERKNYKCQRNMLPLRFRKYMTEFQDGGVDADKL